MSVLVNDRWFGRELIARRKAAGEDRYDEVWEGLYVMAPLANNEHTELQARLVTLFTLAVGLDSGYRIAPGANISDREDGWQYNYRCPDVVVFAPDTSAIDYGSHWHGGPDFALEITSDDERAHDKLDFYSNVGVRELLIIDRDPWSIELLRHDGTALKTVGVLRPGADQALVSQILPLSFRLLSPAAGKRPAIHATHTTTNATWSI